MTKCNLEKSRCPYANRLVSKNGLCYISIHTAKEIKHENIDHVGAAQLTNPAGRKWRSRVKEIANSSLG